MRRVAQQANADSLTYADSLTNADSQVNADSQNQSILTDQSAIGSALDIRPRQPVAGSRCLFEAVPRQRSDERVEIGRAPIMATPF